MYGQLAMEADTMILVQQMAIHPASTPFLLGLLAKVLMQLFMMSSVLLRWWSLSTTIPAQLHLRMRTGLPMIRL